MGTSGKLISPSPDSFIPALLISFTKIKEFNIYFGCLKIKANLSNIFNSLIYNNYLDGNVYEFTKIIMKNNINIKDLLCLILDTLNTELKQNKLIYPLNYENNNNDESFSFLENNEQNNKEHKTIIESLFFGEEEKISRCSICKENKYNSKELKLLHFDLHSYRDFCDIKKVIQDFEKQKEIKKICKDCQQKTDILYISKLKKISDILIISFDKIRPHTIINYYFNLEIKEELYILICFISNADENNKSSQKYNVFYMENRKWFMYNVEQKNQKEIEDISKINKNEKIL